MCRSTSDRCCKANAQEQEDILKQLVAVVSAINRHGLAVLVTLFPPSLHHELPQTYLDGLDGPKFRAYAAVVERVATRARGRRYRSGGARTDE